MENNTLNHHGIKGMRWGIRRFQNKDGSLTPAGKKRRDQQDDKKPKADEKKAEAPKKKSLSDMSDDDINKAISRAQLEDRYKALRPNVGGEVPKRKNVGDMTNEELREALDRARMEDQYRALRPEKESAIKTLLSTTFKDVIAPAAIKSGERFLEKYMDKMGDELLKDTEDPNSISSLKKLKEKLQLKKDIDDLKNPKEKELNWDDKIKKQAWENNERKRQKEEAEEKAAKEKAAKEAAEKAAKEEAGKQAVKDYFDEWQRGGNSARNTQYSSVKSKRKETVEPDAVINTYDGKRTTDGSASRLASGLAGLLGSGPSSSSSTSGSSWRDTNYSSNSSASSFVSGLLGSGKSTSDIGGSSSSTALVPYVSNLLDKLDD